MKIDRQAGRKTRPPGKPRPAGVRRAPFPTSQFLAARPPQLAPCGGRLIAIPRLNFSLNHRKHNHLQISNRERMHVLHSLFTRHSPLVTAFLMGSSAIKDPNNVPLYSEMQISNRRRNRPERLSCGHTFQPQYLVASSHQLAQPCIVPRATPSNSRIQNNLQHDTHSKEHAWPLQ